MSARAHERSPWRIAFESLLASRGSASETVTLKVNAKGEVQPEVTAVAKDGEHLSAVYGRAAAVLETARRDFRPSHPAKSVQGVTEPFDGGFVSEDEVPF